MGDTKRIIVAIVAVVAIVVSGLLIARYFKKQAQGKTYAYTAKVICETCKKEGEVRVEQAKAFPVKCPSCGAMTAYQLYVCRNPECGNKWMVKPVDPNASPDEQARQRALYMGCPVCGNTNVGAADTELKAVETKP